MVLITVSPWLIRNRVIFGAYTLAHTAGINLLDGNNPYNDTGSSDFDRANPLLGDLRALPVFLEDLQTEPLPNMFDGKEVERDARARSIAFDYMINNPGRVFSLLPRKFLSLFRTDTEGLYWSVGMMPFSDSLFKAIYRYAIRFSQLYYDLMIILFIVSLPILLRVPIGPQHIGLAIIVLLTFVYLVLFGAPRYHFSMMPWVAIYSGLGAQALLLGTNALQILESTQAPAHPR
jgi:hypothetical protein